MPPELTGTAFDYMRMDLPCPECGKTNKQPISKLVANDSVRCTYCGLPINLSAKGTRASIAEFANKAKEIKKLRGR